MEEESANDWIERLLYSNLLLLGYDSNKLHMVKLTHGMLRHSNKKAGEAILYFLFSCLRPPQQLAKDFYNIWPIFENRQSRDFRKVVQNLVAELDGVDALPKSTSRISMLATSGGDRFVEFLWYLSAHALREAYIKSLGDDITTAEVPPPLPLVACNPPKAAALLNVAKARVKILGKQVLEAAPAAVQMQAHYTRISNEQKAEYEAMEAKKAHTIEQKKLLLSRQNSTASSGASYREHILKERVEAVGEAAELWTSLVKSAEGIQALAGGPVEDIITERAHRYGIDGAKLREARAQSTTDKERVSSEDEASESNNHQKRLGAEFPLEADGQRFSSDHNELSSLSRELVSLDISGLIEHFTGVLEHVEKETLSMVNSEAGPGFLKLGEKNQSFLREALAEELQHKARLEETRLAVKKTRQQMEEEVAILRQKVAEKEAQAAPILAKRYGKLGPREVTSRGGPTAPHGAAPAWTATGGGDTSVPVEGDVVAAGSTGRLQLVPPTPAMKPPQLRSQAQEQTPERLPPVQDSPYSTTSSAGISGTSSLITGQDQSYASLSLPDMQLGEDTASLRKSILEAAKRRFRKAQNSRSHRISSHESLAPALISPTSALGSLPLGSFSEHQAVPVGVAKWTSSHIQDHSSLDRSHSGAEASNRNNGKVHAAGPAASKFATATAGTERLRSGQAQRSREAFGETLVGGNIDSKGKGRNVGAEKLVGKAMTVKTTPEKTRNLSGRSPDLDMGGGGDLGHVDSFDLLAPIPMSDLPHDLPDL